LSPAYLKPMKSGKLKRVYLYGGILTENIVQALARGLLCSAMGRLEYQEKMPVVMTVHDEIICEVRAELADLERFKKAMIGPTGNGWEVKMGVPIQVDAWSGTRYRK
jgi:DNA polymerase bacteriophage-type